MAGSAEEPAGGAPDPGRASAGSFVFPPAASAVIVTTTLPSEAEAARIARAVVDERLAACAQRQGPIASTYRWQGEVEEAAEWYVHCKTAASRAAALMVRIKELHPYDVPEILVTPVLGGHPPYLEWVEGEVRVEK
jgi:periplasmic divalent cation tolerance protein